MKIKDGFLLRQVAGQNVVMPMGSDLDLNMMITLNETGAFLWMKLPWWLHCWQSTMWTQKPLPAAWQLS